MSIDQKTNKRLNKYFEKKLNKEVDLAYHQGRQDVMEEIEKKLVEEYNNKKDIVDENSWGYGMLRAIKTIQAIKEKGKEE